MVVVEEQMVQIKPRKTNCIQCAWRDLNPGAQCYRDQPLVHNVEQLEDMHTIKAAV